ncbi:MAG: DUF3048 domain-containing protein [Anaerolineae bacterium]
MRRLTVLISLAALLAALGGCQPNPAAAPVPTVTPRPPQPSQIAATSTPLIGGEVQPPLTPTAGVVNTITYPVGPDSYPEGVNPLTGLPVGDPAVLQRPPLAIKVSNDPLARPPSGLQAADMVFEHYAEGGVTRFTAVLYSQTAPEVGSLRSGRLLDLEIVPMLDALYVASGFSGGVQKRMEAASWVARNFSSPFGYEKPPYMVRINRQDRAFEHTLYAVPDEFWGLAEERGVSRPPDLTPGLAFLDSIPPGGTPASVITVDFSTADFEVRWEYDPQTGRYFRSQAGKPHIDYLTGEQITAENVMFVGAMHVDTDILEDGYRGLPSTEIQIWGEGPASLFRDGQRYEGRWSRLDPEQMLAFTDLEGNILYFKPGRTWFEMVPIGFDRLFTEP